MGYVVAHRQPTLFANAPVIWIQEVMVSEDLRGVGVGSTLIRHVEWWARDQGAAYVSLATRRASQFYRALGFVESAAFFKKAIDD